MLDFCSSMLQPSIEHRASIIDHLPPKFSPTIFRIWNITIPIQTLKPYTEAKISTARCDGEHAKTKPDSSWRTDGALIQHCRGVGPIGSPMRTVLQHCKRSNWLLIADSNSTFGQFRFTTTLNPRQGSWYAMCERYSHSSNAGRQGVTLDKSRLWNSPSARSWNP